mmetsp:Transcript_81034/g.204011  ORF Transcript_81034/g.204011 Transcript_81034/m.204011 type:complete len:206 (-) Transcript_81034:30-647(-)
MWIAHVLHLQHPLHIMLQVLVDIVKRRRREQQCMHGECPVALPVEVVVTSWACVVVRRSHNSARALDVNVAEEVAADLRNLGLAEGRTAGLVRQWAFARLGRGRARTAALQLSRTFRIITFPGTLWMAAARTGFAYKFALGYWNCQRIITFPGTTWMAAVARTGFAHKFALGFWSCQSTCGQDSHSREARNGHGGTEQNCPLWLS